MLGEEMQLENIEGAIKNGTIQRKRRGKKAKHNTICVGHHFTEANTHNTNKT
jgi:hypothetical protein